MKKILLQDYLKNLSNFSDEQISETKETPIEQENFQINYISKEAILEGIKKFYILKGYSVSDSSIAGAFNIENADRLVAFFVFTPIKLSNIILITVTIWGKLN